MANAELYHPLLEELGMYLPYNHIVNQIIYLEGNEKITCTDCPKYRHLWFKQFNEQKYKSAV